jgi:twitching motility protein PilT
VHIHAGSPPLFRIHTVIRPSNYPAITAEAAIGIAKSLMDDRRWADFLQKRDADFSHEIPGLGRFRVNAHFQRGTVALAIRPICNRVRPLAELFLPEIVTKLTFLHRGLVLITGPTGSGKSTTLAAIIGKINRTRAERIITIEDPIEFQHDNHKSLVSQVEVGTDSDSYETALRAMMRQDPDTILIGEIRDSFSLTTALRAADTGHLVFTTVHAANATMTVERLVSMFDPLQKDLQQTQLGMNLVAVACQRLAKRREGKGRVPVVEIMMATPLVRKFILDGEFEKLPGTVGNREAGSQSFDQHLTELFQKQIIDVNEAKRLASNVDALTLALRGIGNSDSRLR